MLPLYGRKLHRPMLFYKCIMCTRNISKNCRLLLVAFVVLFTVASLNTFRANLAAKQFRFLGESFINVMKIPVLETAQMTMRDNLTIFTNISTGLILPGFNDSHAEEIFHRFASEIQVICPLSKRLGNKADGGWDVCLYGPYKPRQPCLVYSFGINNDWSFDDSVVSNYNCSVRAFDPSMQATDHKRGTHIMFYKQGISGTDEVNQRGWQLKTLQSFVKLLNDTDKTIDYLKIDVEYSEWSALEAILNSTILSKVKQFGLETHTREIKKTSRSTTKDLVYYSDILRRLQDAGFYRWYWHYNRYGIVVSKNTHRNITCCYEMVFVNVNWPIE